MSETKNLDTDINLGNLNFISVKSNLLVRMDDKLVVFTPDGGFELDIQITADLETVPEKYRELFLNMLSAKFFNKTNFIENPFTDGGIKNKNRWWKRYLNNLNFF